MKIEYTPGKIINNYLGYNGDYQQYHIKINTIWGVFNYFGISRWDFVQSKDGEKYLKHLAIKQLKKEKGL